MSKERGPYVSSRNFTERETETGGGRRRRCARTPGRICSINGSLSDYFVPSGRLRVGSALEGPVPRADAGAEPAPHGPPRRQSQLRIPCPTNDDRYTQSPKKAGSWVLFDTVYLRECPHSRQRKTLPLELLAARTGLVGCHASSEMTVVT